MTDSLNVLMSRHLSRCTLSVRTPKFAVTGSDKALSAGTDLSLVQGDKNVIAGLQDAVLGMKAGGKRRVLVPPERGYTSGMDLQPTPPTYAAQRQILNHAKEPLMFELQLVKIRNKGR